MADDASTVHRVMSHKFKSKLKSTWPSVGCSFGCLTAPFTVFTLYWLDRSLDSKYVYYKHFMHSLFLSISLLLLLCMCLPQFNLGLAKNFAILLHKDAKDKLKKKKQMITKRKKEEG